MPTCRFDLPDVRAAAERVIVNMKLTTDNFTHWLEVARRFHLDAALENCLKYAEAPDNFSPLFACATCTHYCLLECFAAAMLTMHDCRTNDICTAVGSDNLKARLTCC